MTCAQMAELISLPSGMVLGGPKKLDGIPDPSRKGAIFAILVLWCSISLFSHGLMSVCVTTQVGVLLTWLDRSSCLISGMAKA